MSKIKGIGYNAKPNQTTKWIWPGGTSAGETPFNPSAPNPFGTGPAGVLDPVAFDSRYGKRPIREDGTIANLSIDAETIFEAGTRAMQIATDRGIQFGDGYTGTPTTHDMKVSILEAHDFAATKPKELRKLMDEMGVGGGANVVIPAPLITKISSPGPGKINLSWRTRLEPYGFEVSIYAPLQVFKIVDLGVMSDQRSARSGEIETHLNGVLTLRVRSYLVHGSRREYGPWSPAQNVIVEEGTETGPDPDPSSPTSPTIPDSSPNPSPGPGHDLSPLPDRVDELWSWVNTTLWPCARPAAIELLRLFREVMTRWRG